jgi:ABC-type histidine transport system ATPase subunit
MTALAEAGATVVVCEHREEYLEAIPELRMLGLGGPVVEEAAIPKLEPYLQEPQSQKLEVEGLTVLLGGRPVLQDLSFSAEMGHVVAVVGLSSGPVAAFLGRGDFGALNTFLS